MRLRRLRMSDLDFVYALHSDPAAHVHGPASRHTSPDQSEQALTSWTDHWAEHGFGYWLCEDFRDGRPLGCAGVRRTLLEGREVLNLYYRFSPDTQGSGLGREASREATAFAAEWLPHLPVTAVIRPDNAASIRTASASGLTSVGSARHRDDAPGQTPSLLFTAPQVLDPGPRVLDEVTDELVDLWHRVNEAGGAVGFYGPTTTADVRTRLSSHLAAMAAGSTSLGMLREAGTDRLLGVAFWEYGTQPMVRHVAVMKRLMVEPDATGRNLGRLLVAGMHALARGRGVQISRLTYRGGTSLGAFYGRIGYREIGRLPGGLSFATPTGPDIRDDVEMAQRLDGRSLDGRSLDGRGQSEPAARVT